MEIQELFAYSDNCRALLLKTLLENEAHTSRPLQPPMREFRSIREILSHMAGAEERWIGMRIHGRPVVRYDERAAPSIAGIFADWEGFRAETRRFLATLDRAGLQRRIHTTVGDREVELTIEQVLFHLMNHETHHRAQISMALQQFGVDPPDFDFVFLKAQPFQKHG